MITMDLIKLKPLLHEFHDSIVKSGINASEAVVALGLAMAVEFASINNKTNLSMTKESFAKFAEVCFDLVTVNPITDAIQIPDTAFIREATDAKYEKEIN